MPYLVVARFNDVNDERFLPFWNDVMSPRFADIKGLARSLMLCDVQDNSYVHLALFESAELAKAGFEVLTEELEEVWDEAEYLPINPDVKWVVPDSEKMYNRSKLLQADVFSLSTWTVGLGFADRATAKLALAFEEIHAMPGLGGHVIGHSQNLQDEITAIAAWDTVDAAWASIPTATDHDIRVYKAV